MRAISARRLYRWLPMIMLLIVAVTGAVGAFTLGYVKNRLLATTGESLALAAADIADKLDRILYERYGDIQVMAQAPVLRGRDPDAEACEEPRTEAADGRPGPERPLEEERAPRLQSALDEEGQRQHQADDEQRTRDPRATPR